MPTAAELRALADHMERLEILGDVARAAKDAYRADPGNPDLRARHRVASQALADVRTAMRLSEVLVADGTPGSTTVRTAVVAATGEV